MYAQSGGRCFGNVLVVFVAAGRLVGRREHSKAVSHRGNLAWKGEEKGKSIGGGEKLKSWWNILSRASLLDTVLGLRLG